MLPYLTIGFSILRLSLLFAISENLFSVKNVKVHLTHYHKLGYRVLRSDWILLMKAALQDLLSRQLEDSEQNFNQVRPIEVMKVLLSEVCLVTGLHPANDHSLPSLGRLLNQIAECLIRYWFVVI